MFDNKAFREAVINAVLHNKWVEGNEPMISVFSDRIEILYRGTIPPAQTMEEFFLGESIPVNEKLLEIFLQLHISEKPGRGVPKIIEKTPAHSCDFSRELASQLLINIFIIYMANPHKYINLTVCMERLRIMCFPFGFLFL